MGIYGYNLVISQFRIIKYVILIRYPVWVFMGIFNFGYRVFDFGFFPSYILHLTSSIKTWVNMGMNFIYPAVIYS